MRAVPVRFEFYLAQGNSELSGVGAKQRPVMFSPSGAVLSTQNNRAVPVVPVVGCGHEKGMPIDLGFVCSEVDSGLIRELDHDVLRR